MGRILGSLAVCLLASLAGCRAPGAYPDRPLFILCPWGAGGGTDQASRQMAALLERELGVAVNVVNATGGQGVTGHSRGARARPDGHTLTMMTVELNMLHWRGLTSVTHESFFPLALYNRDAAALFVRSDAPWSTLRALEAHIKDSPGALRASGSAQGGIWHLAVAGWYAAIGEDPATLNWLSSQGAASALAELLAGTVDVVCCSLPEAAAQMAGGKVRCLGVMATERVTPKFSDVPTFAEQGYDWSIGGWRALGVPRDTPEAIRDVLVPAVKRVVYTTEFREFMGRQGFDWRYEDPRTARASLARTDQALGELIRSDAFASIRRGRFGPGVYPLLLAIALVGVLAGLVATGGLRRPRAEGPPGTGWTHFAEGVGFVVLFVLLVRSAGFVPTTGVLLGLFFWRLGVTPGRAILLSALVVPTTYLLFSHLLRVDLPRGPLGW
ncbi:MAG: tripartite tricarboxylate transporter TctB family protein [Acidobacteria bacterium]|nr:tripartite tricarboxylate transporter TctB family protein [Acidobacteriota bacterium]